MVLTAVIGVWLLRIQGLSTLTRAQQKLQENELPARELLEGMALVVAGAFLLTPGFFTDTIGFLLLFPPTRIWLASPLPRVWWSRHARATMHGHLCMPAQCRAIRRRVGRASNRMTVTSSMASTTTAKTNFG